MAKPSQKESIKIKPKHLFLFLGLALSFLSQDLWAQDSDFWSHWSDGKAEISTYHLKQPRYGQIRSGKAILIFVTEDFSDSKRVKADPDKNPDSDVFPVLKLNHIRHFQTGIYDYKVMTSVFSRIKEGLSPVKVSFSSQEWCGHVWHQMIPKGGKLHSISHSYFDGEADRKETLKIRSHTLLEDALWIWLRGLKGSVIKKAEKKTYPLIPSLFSRRLNHLPLQYEKLTIEHLGEEKVQVSAGTFSCQKYGLTLSRPRQGTIWIETAYPHRIIKWAYSDGETADLLASKRLAYWQLNQLAGKKYLKGLRLDQTSR